MSGSGPNKYDSKHPVLWMFKKALRQYEDRKATDENTNQASRLLQTPVARADDDARFVAVLVELMAKDPEFLAQAQKLAAINIEALEQNISQMRSGFANIDPRIVSRQIENPNLVIEQMTKIEAEFKQLLKELNLDLNSTTTILDDNQLTRIRSVLRDSINALSLDLTNLRNGVARKADIQPAPPGETTSARADETRSAPPRLTPRG
jgi:SMC interacting uncharacterized protein involved in chromosome segregation